MYKAGQNKEGGLRCKVEILKYSEWSENNSILQYKQNKLRVM